MPIKRVNVFTVPRGEIIGRPAIDAADLIYSIEDNVIYANTFDETLRQVTINPATITSGQTTTVNAGSNILVSGTSLNPFVSLVNSPNIFNLNFSGSAVGDIILTNTISASTIISGSTNLYDIFLTANDGNDITRVQPGLNTYTGGTGNNPTINISAATLSSLSVSGNSLFNTLSANTLSGGTFYSGSTDLNSIFQSIEGNFIQNIITVGIAGNVDFTSIKSAVDSISGNSSFNRYKIQVGPGIYEVQ